ncbi:hypothetical protein TRIP_B360009 [uncultured Desulfatiglans sp.]|nr:hypothetical protein TRIP_B360009 [uncultured Desulfatiglans sp.]
MDTGIFSPLLYRLSYLGATVRAIIGLRVRQVKLKFTADPLQPGFSIRVLSLARALIDG